MKSLHNELWHRKSVLYVSLKFISICMLNVTVTFLNRFQFFLGNWNAFVLYSLQGFSCKLKKKKETFLPMESFQNTYRGYKKIYCRALYWCQQNCGFHPGVMSEQGRASFTVPTRWNKRSIQRGALGWSQVFRVFMHGHTSL